METIYSATYLWPTSPLPPLLGSTLHVSSFKTASLKDLPVLWRDTELSSFYSSMKTYLGAWVHFGPPFVIFICLTTMNGCVTHYITEKYFFYGCDAESEKD